MRRTLISNHGFERLQTAGGATRSNLDCRTNGADVVTMYHAEIEEHIAYLHGKTKSKPELDVFKDIIENFKTFIDEVGLSETTTDDEVKECQEKLQKYLSENVSLVDRQALFKLLSNKKFIDCVVDADLNSSVLRELAKLGATIRLVQRETLEADYAELKAGVLETLQNESDTTKINRALTHFRQQTLVYRQRLIEIDVLPTENAYDAEVFFVNELHLLMEAAANNKAVFISNNDRRVVEMVLAWASLDQLYFLTKKGTSNPQAINKINPLLLVKIKAEIALRTERLLSTASRYLQEKEDIPTQDVICVLERLKIEINLLNEIKNGNALKDVANVDVDLAEANQAAINKKIVSIYKRVAVLLKDDLLHFNAVEAVRLKKAVESLAVQQQLLITAEVQENLDACLLAFNQSAEITKNKRETVTNFCQTLQIEGTPDKKISAALIHLQALAMLINYFPLVQNPGEKSETESIVSLMNTIVLGQKSKLKRLTPTDIYVWQEVIQILGILSNENSDDEWQTNYREGCLLAKNLLGTFLSVQNNTPTEIDPPLKNKYKGPLLLSSFKTERVKQVIGAMQPIINPFSNNVLLARSSFILLDDLYAKTGITLDIVPLTFDFVEKTYQSERENEILVSRTELAFSNPPPQGGIYVSWQSLQAPELMVLKSDTEASLASKINLSPSTVDSDLTPLGQNAAIPKLTWRDWFAGATGSFSINGIETFNANTLSDIKNLVLKERMVIVAAEKVNQFCSNDLNMRNAILQIATQAYPNGMVAVLLKKLEEYGQEILVQSIKTLSHLNLFKNDKGEIIVEFKILLYDFHFNKYIYDKNLIIGKNVLFELEEAFFEVVMQVRIDKHHDACYQLIDNTCRQRLVIKPKNKTALENILTNRPAGRIDNNILATV